MYFSKLSKKEKQIVFQCINAILKGNFLEYEFQTRLGVDNEDLQKVLNSFPKIDDSKNDSNETLAINNCLNEVCYGLSFSEAEWQKWFSVDRNKIIETYRNWAKIRGWQRTGIM